MKIKHMDTATFEKIRKTPREKQDNRKSYKMGRKAERQLKYEARIV